MAAKLCFGAVARLYTDSPVDFQPTLQVNLLECMREQGVNRWVAGLSDGELFAVAMLTDQAVQALHGDDAVKMRSLVRLESWTLGDVRQGQSMIYITAMRHLELCDSLIGDPKKYFLPAPGSASGGSPSGGAVPAAFAVTAHCAGQGILQDPELRGFCLSQPRVAAVPSPQRSGVAGSASAPAASAACASVAAGGSCRSAILLDAAVNLRGEATAGLSAGSRDQDPEISIDQLSGYRARWRVVARVTKKTAQKTFKYKAKEGDGKMFSADLLDSKGNETRATFFGGAVDAFFDLLQERKMFSLSNGRVKKGDKRFCKFEHEITFDENAIIVAVDDDGGCPQMVYNFKPLASIENLAPGETLDVVAVVAEVDAVMEIALKAGGSKTRQNVTLVDDSGVSCRLTLWAEFCENSYAVGSVALFKGVRVSDFGGKSLNTANGSVAIVDAQAVASIARATAVAEWFRLSGPAALQDARSLSSERGPSNPPQTIEELRADGMQLEAPNPGGAFATQGAPAQLQRYHTIEPATVTFLPHDRPPFYMACPVEIPDEKAAGNGKTRTCNKKMEQSGGVWCCSFDHQCQEPTARWIAQFAIGDHTGNQYVSSFDETGQKILGCKASEVAELWLVKESDLVAAARIEQLFKAAQYKRWRLRLKSRKEVWNDEERLKFSVLDVSPVDVVKDARAKLAEVLASLSAQCHSRDQLLGHLELEVFTVLHNSMALESSLSHVDGAELCFTPFNQALPRLCSCKKSSATHFASLRRCERLLNVVGPGGLLPLMSEDGAAEKRRRLDLGGGSARGPEDAASALAKLRAAAQAAIDAVASSMLGGTAPAASAPATSASSSFASSLSAPLPAASQTRPPQATRHIACLAWDRSPNMHMTDASNAMAAMGGMGRMGATSSEAMTAMGGMGGMGASPSEARARAALSMEDLAAMGVGPVSESLAAMGGLLTHAGAFGMEPGATPDFGYDNTAYDRASSRSEEWRLGMELGANREFEEEAAYGMEPGATSVFGHAASDPYGYAQPSGGLSERIQALAMGRGDSIGQAQDLNFSQFDLGGFSAPGIGLEDQQHQDQSQMGQLAAQAQMLQQHVPQLEQPPPESAGQSAAQMYMLAQLAEESAQTAAGAAACIVGAESDLSQVAALAAAAEQAVRKDMAAMGVQRAMDVLRDVAIQRCSQSSHQPSQDEWTASLRSITAQAAEARPVPGVLGDCCRWHVQKIVWPV
ncbi:unnamed protein product [Polarella glacialis]|uniref:Replication protein A subunit n=1 Tax=Polarella glacialis TaxID=89957 RepID=A0A813LMI8_POLGL|nr:unnamed protein product [Polarella glacialis]